MNVNRIRDLCRERGTNLYRLEQDLGFPNGTINKWETSVPAVTRAKAVADFFGVTIDSLLEEGDHAEADK